MRIERLSFCKRAYLSTLFSLLCISPLFSETEVEKTLRFLPDLDRPLAVQLALPQQFTIDKAPGKESYSLVDGVIWADNTTLSALRTQGEKADYNTGFFKVKLTPNVTQTDVETFSFGDDATLREELEKSGAKNVSICRKKWGEYPVVCARFTLQNSVPQATCWVGLNNSGLVLFISYQFPPKKRDLSSDEAIWNTFIDKSTMFSPQDYLKAHGFDITLGTSTITRAKGAIRFLSQKAKKGKTHVLIDTLTPLTDCTIISSTRRTAKEANQTRIDLVIDMECAFQGKYFQDQELIPLLPTPVEKSTLSGKIVYEDEDLVAYVKEAAKQNK